MNRQVNNLTAKLNECLGVSTNVQYLSWPKDTHIRTRTHRRAPEKQFDHFTAKDTMWVPAGSSLAAPALKETLGSDQFSLDMIKVILDLHTLSTWTQGRNSLDLLPPEGKRKIGKITF